MIYNERMFLTFSKKGNHIYLHICTEKNYLILTRSEMGVHLNSSYTYSPLQEIPYHCNAFNLLLKTEFRNLVPFFQHSHILSPKYLSPVHPNLEMFYDLKSPCGPWPLFVFLNLYTFGGTLWKGDQPIARPLPTHRTTQTQNKRRQTTALSGIRTHNPAFQHAETVHALGRTATLIGWPPL
jgi:hypothetical protein